MPSRVMTSADLEAAGWSDLFDAGLAAAGVVGRPFDVIVIGATEAGCMAARQAAEAGASVLLTSDMPWFGWMSSGYGLNQQDCRGSHSCAVIGGPARKFLTKLANDNFSRRAFSHWWKNEGQMRPLWSKKAWADFLAHPSISLLPNVTLTSLTKTGTRITSVAFSNGQSFAPRIVIEGTACGDVVQRALASYSIGREATSLYSEAAAGILAAGKWDNNTNVDPYVTPGNAGSGLLFGVDAGAAGTVGAGDGRVMGFGFRPFLTSTAGEIIPWSEYFASGAPAGYDAAKYELLGRAFAANAAYYGDATSGLGRIFQWYNLSLGTGTVMGGTKIPYVDLNNLAPISVNYPVTTENVEYVTATETRRAEIRASALSYMLGLFYWLHAAADARIPAAVRTAWNSYGFSRYQLAETGGAPGQFYEREGARAVGDFVLKQGDAILNNTVDDTIAFGFYDIDSHTVRRLVVGGLTYVEGAALNSLGTNYGYRVPMRVLFPKVAECTNLVLASQPSVSRVIWSGLRVAPSMMMIGSAAGAVAALAARYKINVQSVQYAQVAAVCDPWDVQDGTVLDVTGTYGHGTITETGGSWVSATSRFGGLAAAAPGGIPQYRTVIAANVTGHKWKAAPNVYADGVYDVYLYYSADVSVAQGGQGRATNMLVNVVTQAGATAVTVSEQVGSTYLSNGGRAEYLGRFRFRAGVPSADYIEIDCNGADGQVAVSGIKLAPA